MSASEVSPLDAVVRAAQALCRPGPRDRFNIVLDELRRVTGADACALLHVEGQGLRPSFISGLLPEVTHTRHIPRHQPRLAALLGHEGPLVFEDDDPRPDPWDGLILDAPRDKVHSCMGCALRFDGREVGVITVDVLTPGHFDSDLYTPLAAFAAMTSLALHGGHHLAPPSPAGPSEPGQLSGRSEAFAQLLRELELVAPTDLPVLILGETGTGKERIAERLHAQSRRAAGPLIRLNCATLPSTLAEAELFGHTPGAFTGARSSRRGVFELADGGTLLLDEIGELPLELQAKLLRTVQSGELWPLGAEQAKTVDVRVIAATHRDLPSDVASGRFRADLYHRLAGYSLQVPPLRERGDDVLLLAEVLLAQQAPTLAMQIPRLSAAAKQALLDHAWPGNVRELEHALTRACLLANAEQQSLSNEGPPQIEAAHLLTTRADPVHARPTASPAASAPPPVPDDFHAAVDDYRKHLILRALNLAEGNWSAAARAMGIDRSNLHRLGRRLGLKP